MDTNLVSLDKNFVFLFKEFNKQKKSYISQIKRMEQIENQQLWSTGQKFKAMKSSFVSLKFFEILRLINNILLAPFYVLGLTVLGISCLSNTFKPWILLGILIIIGVVILAFSSVIIYIDRHTRRSEINNYLNKVTLIKVMTMSNITEELYKLCLDKTNSPKKTFIHSIMDGVGLNAIIPVCISLGITVISNNISNKNFIGILLFGFYCIIFWSISKSILTSYHIGDMGASRDIMLLVVDIYECEMIKNSVFNIPLPNDDKVIQEIIKFKVNIEPRLV